MKLTNVDELKKYLKSNGFRPKDYLGQNFLVDEEALLSAVAAADLSPSDVILEVGPGLGVLTNELVQRVGKVIAVEKDEKLFTILEKDLNSSPGTGEVRRGRGKAIGITAASPSNLPPLAPPILGGEELLPNAQVKIIHQDILRFNVAEHIRGPYKVVANIPYYLTSKLFQYFLEQKNQPKLLVLMVQKEVGERVVAKPGNLSVLGISVQIYADAEIVRRVPKESFWPVPKVDSVILKIAPKISAKSGSASGGKYPEIQDKKDFFRIVKVAFAGKRKQLQNSLSNGLKVQKAVLFDIFRKAKIEPSIRPQDLAIEDWIRLHKQLQISKVKQC